MNDITSSLVRRFLENHELRPMSDDADFERFTIYSIVRKIYGQEYEMDNPLVGGSNDTGIDGLAILVNGELIDSIEEIENLKGNNKYLHVNFVFIQAKIKETFDCNGISAFCRGVEDFFLENYNLRQNEHIEHKKGLYRHIMKDVVKLDENPYCSFYYVSTGYWDDSLKDQKNIMECTKRRLIKSALFKNVFYKIYGANEINQSYRESINNLAVQINFSDKATLPQIPKVESAYIGILPISEFRKLIMDDEGNLRCVYEDNIRDFQDIANPVNKKIEETLSSNGYLAFPLLNNGVTIVADKINQTGNTLILRNYQIVNGCQTSNIIARHVNDERLGNLSIPVKIIETNDEKTKNSITLATNSQTAVKREQLVALTSFQRTLEDYYNSKTDTEPYLVYERRLNQYSSITEIKKTRIITVLSQIKSFAAMFLGKPHRVTSYYGELTKNLASKTSEIFNPRHKPLTYYLSGLALYRLETLFRTGELDSKYKKLRFFILFAFRLTAIKHELDKDVLTNGKKNEKILAPLFKVLTDSKRTATIFDDIIRKIGASSIDITKETLKTAELTKLISELFPTREI